MSAQGIFMVNGFISLAGLALTLLLIPNAGEVTLHEVDRLWECKLLDVPYDGPATKMHNLSLVEAMFIVKEPTTKNTHRNISSEAKDVEKQSGSPASASDDNSRTEDDLVNESAINRI